MSSMDNIIGFPENNGIKFYITPDYDKPIKMVYEGDNFVVNIKGIETNDANEANKNNIVTFTKTIKVTKEEAESIKEILEKMKQANGGKLERISCSFEPLNNSLDKGIIYFRNKDNNDNDNSENYRKINYE
ncbi:MAG: hypothetical protein IJH76_03140 [Clostridia bacterium]|nr:hypothetical protein [Clostridia bacterium]